MSCVVCGSPSVAEMDTETGTAALCDYHYRAVTVKAARIAASEAASQRLQAGDSHE